LAWLRFGLHPPQQESLDASTKRPVLAVDAVEAVALGKAPVHARLLKMAS
jgi:hypothetical protein